MVEIQNPAPPRKLIPRDPIIPNIEIDVIQHAGDSKISNFLFSVYVYSHYFQNFLSSELTKKNMQRWISEN